MIRYERPTADIGALIRWKAALLFRAESLLTPSIKAKPHPALFAKDTRARSFSQHIHTHIA
jgi:hypothetical protein